MNALVRAGQADPHVIHVKGQIMQIALAAAVQMHAHILR